MTQQPQAKYRYNYRALDYQITDIDSTFDLDAQKMVVTAVNWAVRHGVSNAPLRLNGEDLRLVPVHTNNKPWIVWKEEENALVINNLPERFTLKIISEISPTADTVLEGFYQSDGALCTQCEIEGFHHITCHPDHPDVLARFTIEIIADRTKYPFLLSDGNRIVQGGLENGRRWVQWQDPFPKPCYLFVLMAGDFDALRDTFTTRSGRGVALELCVDRGNLDRTPRTVTSLKSSMRWDEERFGPEYDLDIYMIIAVDFFNMGTMENRGLNIFSSKYMPARTDIATDRDYLDIEHVIDHEYFHDWTGNHVTYRGWSQLSLKGGLTVFRDQEFSSDLGSRVVNRINNVHTMHGLQSAGSASPMAYPIRPDVVIEMNNFYVLTIYGKGAEVIHMIHTLFGEENFQRRMQFCFECYDGSAATCDDFAQTVENTSNVDLSRSRRWCSQSGTPVVIVKDDYNPETEQYALAISQRAPVTPDRAEEQSLHIPFAIKLYDNEGRVIPLQKGDHPVDSVLDVTRVRQTFVFDNVYFQPVPVPLYEFFAPIRLEYEWSNQQLIFLMRYARNDFFHWDVAQSLLTTYVRLNVACHQ